MTEQGAKGNGSGAGVFFRGATVLALDAKNRLAIPQRRRDALSPLNGTAGERVPMILTADPLQGCLLLYPLANWEPVEAALMAKSSFIPLIRNMQQVLVGNATEVDLDAAGRILVSPTQRQFAGLDHHVVLVGQGNRFEIWDEAKWQQLSATRIDLSTGALPDELQGFRL